MIDPPHNLSGLGHGKIKHLGMGSSEEPGLRGSIGHDVRALPTPNANGAPILVACKETSWGWVALDGRHPLHAQLSDPSYWIQRYKEKLAGYGISLERGVRKDAVLVEQQLAHFSPEVFRHGQLWGKVDEELGLRIATAGLAFQTDEYGHRLLVAFYHPDEQTPHFGSYIIPVVYGEIKPAGRPKKGQTKNDRKAVKRWRLAAKYLFNPVTCSRLQTKFADYLRGKGFDVVRGIAGSRTGFKKMQLLTKYLHSPLPEVPSFTLPPQVTELPTRELDPGEALRQITEAADSWRHQIIENILSPLQAKALERDTEFDLRRGYQRTAWEKEEELKRYRIDMDLLVKELSLVRSSLRKATQELDAARFVPRLCDVAVLLLGRGHVASEKNAITTFRLPDRMSLEIDSVTETYRRQLSLPSHHSTIDSVLGGGVVNMIHDITGWELTHSLAWVEAQWGPRLMASCLRQATLSEIHPATQGVLEATATSEPVVLGAELMTPTESSWPSVRQVLVEGYRFRPKLIDELAKAGKLGANRFGDLLVTSPGTTVSQVYPLVEGAVLGDGIFPTPDLFTLGSGTEVLAVVDRPLEALALWESIPFDRRSIITVTVVATKVEPGVWGKLRKQFPDAVLLNGLAGADQAHHRPNLQASFAAPIAISPHPAQTWIGVWNRQYENEAGAAAFRAMQERLVSHLQAVLPQELEDPV